MTGKIFINYRRDDSIGMAGRLHDRLAQTFGRDNLFMDVDHIPVGADFVAHLNSQVAACDVVLVVIGPNWLRAKDRAGQRRLHQPDDFVAIEIAAALARDIRVIPVLVDEARMPKESELPDSLKPLARRQAAEVRHAHFGQDAETLVARMSEALGHETAGPGPWRVRAAIGAAAVAVLLLIGWGGYAVLQDIQTKEHALQQREADLKAEQERQAKAAAEAEAKRKADEAEQQRLAAVKVEQERQARIAAELEAKRKATEAEQRPPAVVNSEEPRRGAWIGVNIQQVTDEIAKTLNITPARGALVVGVFDKGPAKTVGIDVGDVIVKFDGKDIKDMRDVPRIVADTPVGKDVQVTIIRKGDEYTKTLKLGSPEERAALSGAFEQGVAAMNNGDLDRAIASFSEAIGLDPKNAFAFFNRGIAYRNKGDNDRAIADYNEAIRLNPKYGPAFNYRGFAYWKKGDNDRAIADYSEAIRLDPKNAFAFCNRGITKRKINDSSADDDIAKARQLGNLNCR